MASRGSALTVSIATDLSKFDTDAASEGLDEVGKAGDEAAQELKKTTSELERLAKQGRDAEKELDKLAKADAFDKMGKEADDAAKKVDAAMDRIGKSGKDNFKKVDDGADHAKHGIDEFKDEAQSTGKEAAASFSGVESGLDAIQEIAANAFAGFGPAGQAAGLLAAAGIGLVFSNLQSAADKANEAKDRVIGLAQAIRDAGGSVAEADIPGKLQEWAFAINDNKSWWELWQKDNTTNLEVFTQKAQEAGISVKEMFDAMTGTDPVAMSNVLDQLNKKILALPASARGERRALIELESAIVDKADETKRAIDLDEDATDALGRKAEAEKAAADAVQGHADAIDAFVDPASTYAALLAEATTKEQEAAQATADATKDKKDSWKDYAKSVKVSVDDYLDQLQRQVVAQEEWATNLGELAKRGVDDGVLAELERMGPEGAPLVAKLTTASDKELKRLVDLFHRQGKAASTQAGEGIEENIPHVQTAAAKAHQKAEAELTKPTKPIPVHVADGAAAAQLAWREAQNYLNGHPLVATIETAPGMLVNGRKVT